MSNYSTPYQAFGEEGIRALVNQFYDLMDQEEEFKALRAMHAADLSPIKTKLAEYLIGWMGGPPLYADKYGGVCMTEPHEPYWIGPDERDQWIACMYKALDLVTDDEELKTMLKEPLFRLADAVRNRDKKKTVDPNIITSG